MDQLPVIGYFPALPLAKNLELGDWVIGPDFAEVPWLSAEFKRHADAVIASTTREDFKLPTARLWHRANGFDGVVPDEPTLNRLAKAVTFATLNANDHLPDSLNAGHYLATAENAALYLRFIDSARGYITHQRGGFLNTHWILGLRIGAGPIALPDAVLPVSRPIVLSSTLARALFDRLGQADPWVRRLDLALEWYAALMANSAAVTHQQRIIALKTAFEILFSTDKSHVCAAALRKMFETVTASRAADFPWVGVIWSPTERTNLQRSYLITKGKHKGEMRPVIRSELEDWFMTLARSRNEIIHQGKLLTTEYAKPPERPLSPYAGPLFWRGERIFRETVKAILGPDVLLCGRHAFRDALAAAFEQLRREGRLHPGSSEGVAVADPGPQESEPETPTRPDRDLAALLLALGVAGANEVSLDRDGGGARTENVSVSVSPNEWELLQAAGAERAAEGWHSCP